MCRILRPYETVILDLQHPNASWPRPYDENRVAVGLQRWAEEAERLHDPAARAAVAAMAGQAAGRALLAALFGNSPYLTQAALREQRLTCRLLREPPEDLFEALMAELTAGAAAARDKAELMQVLRRAKGRVALLAAVADLAGWWPLERVTGALTDLADAALQAGVEFLLGQAAARGEIGVTDTADPVTGSGYAVFALGKHGAGELNYSSDIDIMVLFDQEVIDYRGTKDPTAFYSRLTRDLVELIQARTQDGYVFRTDLRLRPDPGSSPLALSMAAAESYYETLGQNWERAAMIKARAAAGDLEAGRLYLDRLRPFVWRKFLDFAAIEDIHSIKRQIHTHRGHAAVTLAGHNLKVGRGGIREIEFFAQTQQLIAGGREPRLRQPATCDALRALVETGRLAPVVADELIAAYEFLRRVEHRLQMVNDEQTHSLPADEAGLAQIAMFMGFADARSFGDRVLAVLNTVQRHYAALFEAAPSLDDSTGNLVFTGTDDDPETLRTLADLGFAEPSRIAGVVRRWHHGRYRAIRTSRAREKLTALMPLLLESFGATANPDAALLRFDEFLAKLPAGIQLFSLFYANPWLLHMVARIMGTAPNLAEVLSRNANLLDGVLEADFFEPLPDAAALRADLEAALAQARDYQDVLDLTRRWTNDRHFQVGLQVLEKPADAGRAGAPLSDVAEAALGALVPRVEQEFAVAHGRVPGGDLAVVALGKLGGREMTFSSDLDLIFIYDHAAEATASDGARPLAPSQYFARFSQRVISAVTALTAEGRLYEVDMRLRPSGKAGPIAVALRGFRGYHRDTAWTWEHLALTRARVIIGGAELSGAIDDVLRATLQAPRDPAKLGTDVAEMHARVRREHGSDDPWNIKYAAGGLVEAEFLAQCLQLRHAAQHPDVLAGSAPAAFAALGAAGAIDPVLADRLAAATRLLINVQALLRLCASGDFDAAAASADLRSAIATAIGAADFAAAEDALAAAEATIHAAFVEIIGEPNADAGDSAGPGSQQGIGST